MATYNVTATVTSPPTDVSLHVNSTKISMSRDSTGAWGGKTKLDLPNSFPVALIASGLPSSAWTLEIKFTTPPPNPNLAKDYKHSDTIPSSGLSDFKDTVSLAKAGTGTP